MLAVPDNGVSISATEWPRLGSARQEEPVIVLVEPLLEANASTAACLDAPMAVVQTL